LPVSVRASSPSHLYATTVSHTCAPRLRTWLRTHRGSSLHYRARLRILLLPVHVYLPFSFCLHLHHLRTSARAPRVLRERVCLYVLTHAAVRGCASPYRFISFASCPGLRVSLLTPPFTHYAHKCTLLHTIPRSTTQRAAASLDTGFLPVLFRRFRHGSAHTVAVHYCTIFFVLYLFAFVHGYFLFCTHWFTLVPVTFAFTCPYGFARFTWFARFTLFTAAFTTPHAARSTALFLVSAPHTFSGLRSGLLVPAHTPHRTLRRLKLSPLVYLHGLRVLLVPLLVSSLLDSTPPAAHLRSCYTTPAGCGTLLRRRPHAYASLRCHVLPFGCRSHALCVLLHTCVCRHIATAVSTPGLRLLRSVSTHAVHTLDTAPLPFTCAVDARSARTRYTLRHTHLHTATMPLLPFGSGTCTARTHYTMRTRTARHLRLWFTPRRHTVTLVGLYTAGFCHRGCTLHCDSRFACLRAPHTSRHFLAGPHRICPRSHACSSVLPLVPSAYLLRLFPHWPFSPAQPFRCYALSRTTPHAHRTFCLHYAAALVTPPRTLFTHAPASLGLHFFADVPATLHFPHTIPPFLAGWVSSRYHVLDLDHLPFLPHAVFYTTAPLPFTARSFRTCAGFTRLPGLRFCHHSPHGTRHTVLHSSLPVTCTPFSFHATPRLPLVPVHNRVLVPPRGPRGYLTFGCRTRFTHTSSLPVLLCGT